LQTVACVVYVERAYTTVGRISCVANPDVQQADEVDVACRVYAVYWKISAMSD